MTIPSQVKRESNGAKDLRVIAPMVQTVTSSGSDVRPRGANISKREIHQALPPNTPAILTLTEAAELARIARATLKRHVSEGRYHDCVIRGKPLRFWRDRFLQQVMKGEARSASTR